MWHELDMQKMEREENAGTGTRSSEEIEQIVVMERLARYNRGLPCGATALRRHLRDQLNVRPLPSERTLGRILARQGLTHGRTGWYDGE